MESYPIGVKDSARQADVNRIISVYKRAVIVTWLLLLLPLYPLLTYTSINAIIWQRYSFRYAIGLVMYAALVLLWLLMLGLPRSYINRINRQIDDFLSNPWLYGQFVITCTSLTLLTLTAMLLWGWGYNLILGSSVVLLGLWLSILPLFWQWGLKGWAFRLESPGRLIDRLGQNSHLWLPPVIGAGVLLISAVLGFNSFSLQLIPILGLIPAIVAFLIYWRWPAIGLIGLVVAGLVVPSPNLPGGLNVGVIVLVLLIGLHLFAVIVKRRPLRLVPSRTVWPLLALVLGAILSFGVGNLPWFTFAQPAPMDAQLGGLFIYILAAGAFLLIAHQVRDLHWLKWLTWLFVALGSVHIAGWLVPGLGKFTGPLLQLGTFNNSLFWVWLVSLSASQSAFNRELHFTWRVVLGGVALTTLYVGFVLNNDWKSGYLPPIASVGAMIAFHAWWVAIPAVLAAYPVVLYLSSQAIASDDYSYSTRVDALLIMLEIIKVNPILGLGPANYYWYTPLFPIRGWAVQFNSHNNYVDIVAQTGLVGLACFFWFALEVAWLAWKLRTKVPAGGFAWAYVYGVMGGLAGTLVAAALADWVLPFPYNIGLTGFRMTMLGWMFLGGLVCIEQIYMGQSHPQEINLTERVGPRSPGRLQTAVSPCLNTNRVIIPPKGVSQ
ncbi:MAG: hypothetical protein HS126_24895 [Anaerolineales bacterium]|nr:hypothetical protein [Anaerolineales bacterium]